MLNQPETECIYCNAMVSDDETVPAVDDDEAWGQLAAEHGDGCEWCATRAHRREVAEAE